jgi:hypothetical protein
MPGGKTAGLQRGLAEGERLAIRKAKNILANALDTETLQAAAREALGEVVALKPSGQPFDHIGKVKKSLDGLVNAERNINRSLRDTTLNSEARRALQRTLAKARDGIQRTRDYMEAHNIK